METSVSVWPVIFILPILGVGIVCTFFPQKVVQLYAKLQKGTFEQLGLQDKEIDRLPIYSSLFGENYSERLKRAQEKPKSLSGFIAWIRIFGSLTLILFVILMCSVVFAYRANGMQ